MKKTRKEIETELAHLDSEIAAHPLASEPVTAAHAIIEQHGEENKEIIQQRLAEQNLPSLDEVGRLTAKHTFSWWKLHRARKKLIAKIERLG